MTLIAENIFPGESSDGISSGKRIIKINSSGIEISKSAKWVYTELKLNLPNSFRVWQYWIGPIKNKIEIENKKNQGLGKLENLKSKEIFIWDIKIQTTKSKWKLIFLFSIEWIISLKNKKILTEIPDSI